MKAAIAMLHFMAAAVLAGVAFGFVRGRLDPFGAWGAAVLGMVVACGALWSLRKTPREIWRIDPWGGAALGFFALFALRCFLWVAFESSGSLWVFSPNNLGDFSLHLAYVNYLANGAPFWPENPIYAGKALTYPLGTDLLNGLLHLLGVDVLRGFTWVGLIASAVTAAMLWRWSRGFAVAGFLCAGGWLGFDFFRRLSVVDYQSDAAWAESGLIVAWKSLPLALFVTQRGLLYAIPAGLALLASWRARFFEPGDDAHRLPLWSEVLLYAAMPIFHLHTFLFLSVLAAGWFLAVAKARWHLLAMVASALIPATAQVWWITAGFSGESMIGWQPGWMQGEQNFFAFWFLNFGALPLLVGWLLWRMIRNFGPLSALAIGFPALTVFGACCFVKFAPWEWDNTKLMLWSYLAILPALWQELLKSRALWVRAVVGFVLFFSGAISLLGGLRGEPVNESSQDRASKDEPMIGYQIAFLSEIEGFRQAARDIPITERFVGYPTYNHPVLLAGRVMAMGYEGHVWSHGIAFQARKQKVESLLRGEPGWREVADELGVRWLFWGEQERANYPGSTQPWQSQCRLHAEGIWGALYDLTQSAARTTR